MKSNQLSTEELAQWWKKRGKHELRQILYWCWDPIGINDAYPLTEDEYDGYAGTLFGLVKREATADEIADHLSQLEHERMDMPTSAKHRLAVAHRVIEWYPQSLDYWEMHRSA